VRSEKEKEEIERMVAGFEEICHDPRVRAEFEAIRKRNAQALRKNLDRQFTI